MAIREETTAVRGNRAAIRTVMEEPAAIREETTAVRDHRAAIRIVMEEPAATREETTAVRDHRAAIRTVMEELAVIREETTVVRDHRAASKTVEIDHRAVSRTAVRDHRAVSRIAGTDRRAASRTAETDHRAVSSTVETDHRAVSRTVEIDHRAASRTVTETRAVSAPVSEKIRTEIIQTEMAAETAAVLLAAEITVHLLLTARSRQSQAAPARQTRTLIRMTVLTRETEKKMARRKHQKQERELSSCRSLRRKKLRLRMLRPLLFQSA